MPAPSGSLQVAPTDRGCAIRLRGHGTTEMSITAEQVARRVFAQSEHAVVMLDLSECDYLDSTFLGLLMTLHRACGQKSGRFVVAAPPAKRIALLKPSHLDTVIPAVDAMPALKVAYTDIPEHHVDRIDMLRHLARCHASLAEVEGPMQSVFQRIADEINRELNAIGDPSAAWASRVPPPGPSQPPRP